MNHPLRLSIIIPTFNRIDKLPKCLDSIQNQTFPGSDYEVIVVDDGSTDTTHRFLEQYAQQTPLNFRFITQTNRGPAAARNAGIHIAKGSIVWITGDDYVLDSECLSQHVHWHESKYTDENISVLGFATWHPDLKISDVMLWVEHGGFQFFYDELEHDTEVSFFDFITCNISFKRRFFEKSGPFCEEYPKAMGEDTDLGIRFATNGGRLIYNKNAITYHDHLITETESVNRVYYLGEVMALQMKLWPNLFQIPYLPSPSSRAFFGIVKYCDQFCRPLAELLPPNLRQKYLRIIFKSIDLDAKSRGVRNGKEALMRAHFKHPPENPCVLVRFWPIDTRHFYRFLPMIREDYPDYNIVVLGDDSYVTQITLHHPFVSWFVLSPTELNSNSVGQDWKNQIRKLDSQHFILISDGNWADYRSACLMRKLGVINTVFYNESGRNRLADFSSWIGLMFRCSVSPRQSLKALLDILLCTRNAMFGLMMIPVSLLRCILTISINTMLKKRRRSQKDRNNGR